MNLLKKIGNFIRKNKKIFIILMSIIAIFMIDGVTSFAFAADGDSNVIVETLNTAIKMLAFFLGLSGFIISMLLSPEWVNGSLLGLTSYLKEIWILVSNIVYVIFAFILIGIAFMNIVGMGGDTYQVKKALPKFVIGILIVPFSWFIVQFIVSLTSVLSVIALSLPFDSFQGYSQELKSVKIPNNCTVNFVGKINDIKKLGGGQSATNNSGTATEPAASDKFWNCENIEDKEGWIDADMNKEGYTDNMYTLISLYIYGVMGIQTTDMLTELDLSLVKEITDIGFKLLFDIVFAVVYMVLIVALMFVLITRGFWIWIYMMLSPLFGLLFFFGDKTGGDNFFTKITIKQFISLALVPVYTILALSFGMLFIYIIGKGMTVSSMQYNDSAINVEQKNGFDVLTIGGATLKVKAPANSMSGNLMQGGYNAATEVGGFALGVLGTIIIKIFGIIILWGAVMAAFKTNKITEALVAPLDQFGKNIGEVVTKAPQYTPIPGTGQSMQSLNQLSNMGKTHFTTTMSNKAASDFAGKYGLFGQTSSEYMKIHSDIENIANSNDFKGIAKALDRIILTSKGNVNELITNSEAQKSLYNLAIKAGKADDLKDLKIDASSDVNSNDKLKSLIALMLPDKNLHPYISGSIETAGQFNDVGDIETYYKSINKDNQNNNPNNINNNINFVVPDTVDLRNRDTNGNIKNEELERLAKNLKEQIGNNEAYRSNMDKFLINKGLNEEERTTVITELQGLGVRFESEEDED